MGVWQLESKHASFDRRERDNTRKTARAAMMKFLVAFVKLNEKFRCLEMTINEFSRKFFPVRPSIA